MHIFKFPVLLPESMIWEIDISICFFYYFVAFRLGSEHVESKQLQIQINFDSW